MKCFPHVLSALVAMGLFAGCGTTTTSTETPDAGDDVTTVDDASKVDSGTDATTADSVPDTVGEDVAKQDATPDVQGTDATIDAGTDAEGTDTAGTDAAVTDSGPDTAGTDAVLTDLGPDIAGTDAMDMDMVMDTGPDVAGTDAVTADLGPDTAGSDTVSAPTCTEYCATIETNCTGGNAQYTSINDCMNYCSAVGKIPLGVTGATSGDSVGCRTYHASAAAGDPVFHCPHAGPSGGNMCGTWCDVYCDLAMSNCTDTNQLYDDTEQCMAACGELATTGAALDKSGDSVQCRITHLGYAGVDGANAAIHCPHALIFPAVSSPCGPATAPAPKTWNVTTTTSYTFDPKFLWIRAGDSVKLTVGSIHSATQVLEATWNANGITPLAGGFDIAGGNVQTVLFAVASEVYYVCKYHVLQGMKGKIVVQ
jgi:plastocyanin